MITPARTEYDRDARGLRTINIGNTHISLVTWSGDGQMLACEWLASRSDVRGLQRMAAVLQEDAGTPCPVLLCGVVPGIKTQLLKKLKSGLRRDVFIFRKDVLPEIEIVPQPEEKAGDDRIAAALGALAQDASVPWVVADIGTAMTCNAVTPAVHNKLPRFEGGLIVPGAAMCLKALAQQTAQLPEIDPAESDLSEFSFIGRSTEQAIGWGVALSQVVTLLAMIEGQRKSLGPRTRVAITGGGATALREALRFAAPGPVDFEFCPWLVHRGLFSAWKEFAEKHG